MNLQKPGFFSTLILAFCLVAQSAAAENLQRIIPYDSPAVTELRTVYRELGLAFPSDTAPWTEAEVRLMFDRALERSEELSGAGRRALAEVRKDLQVHPDYTEFDGKFTFDFDLTLAVEGYAGFGNTDTREWVRGYGDRLPFLYAPFSVYLYDSFYARTSITLMQDPFTVLERQENGTTLPLSFNDLDSGYPYHTALSYGGDHWNVRMARETLDWGNGKTGNLLVSDNGVVHDFLEFTTFWDRFKFSFLLLGQDNYEWAYNDLNSNGVADPGEYIMSPTPTQEFYTPVMEAESDGVSSQESYRHFIAHRLEFLPWDNLSLVLTEAVMYQDPSFQFRYLNPVMIFHNWYQKGSANYFMTLEANYSPVPGLNLYGQFLGDQIAFYFNRQTDSSQNIPPGMGYLAGVDYTAPVSQGYLFGGLEWVKLDPYNYIDRSGVNLWYERHIISNYYGGRHILLITPLGYKYGPDSLTWYGEAGYRVPGKWELKASGEYSLKGQNTIFTEWSDADGKADLTTPSGPNPIGTMTLGLHSNIDASLIGLDWDASFGTELFVLKVDNFNHEPDNDFWDVQVNLFASYKF